MCDRSAYSSRRGSFGNVEPVDPDLARVGLEQSDDVLDRDRLSGARIADDDHRLALVDLEGEAVEDALGAEGLVDVVELNHVDGGAVKGDNGEAGDADDAKCARQSEK